MAKVPMTKAGFEKILKEHEYLNKVELPAIIEKVAEARANGDLKENAEYHAAREKQGQIQDKIKYLEEQIANAQVIENSGNSDTIVFGSQVTIVDPDDEVAKVFELKEGKFIKMLDATDEHIEFDLKKCRVVFDFAKIWG